MDSKEFLERQNQEPGMVGERVACREQKLGFNKISPLAPADNLRTPVWQDHLLAGHQSLRCVSLALHCLFGDIYCFYPLPVPASSGCMCWDEMHGKMICFLIQSRLDHRSNMWTDGMDCAHSRNAGLWDGRWGELGLLNYVSKLSLGKGRCVLCVRIRVNSYLVTRRADCGQDLDVLTSTHFSSHWEQN